MRQQLQDWGLKMRIIWLLCLAMLVCDGVKELFGTVSPNGTVDVIFIQLREITAECLMCVERARATISSQRLRSGVLLELWLRSLRRFDAC